MVTRMERLFCLFKLILCYKRKLLSIPRTHKDESKQIRSQLKIDQKLNVIEHLNASTNSIEIIVNKHNETEEKVNMP